jgi:hypothetical protein
MVSSSILKSAAATFSSRWLTLEVPGIGRITGDRDSNHARATCDQALRVGVQSLSDDLFTYAGAIGIRSVDEIDSQLDSAPDDPDGLSAIRRLAPNPLTRDPHCAESQASDGENISDQEFASSTRELLLLRFGLVFPHIVFSSCYVENLTAGT